MSSLETFIDALLAHGWTYTEESKVITVRNHQYLQRKWNTKEVPAIVVDFGNGYDHAGTAYFTTDGRWASNISPVTSTSGTRNRVWRGRSLTDVLDEIERDSPARVRERQERRKAEDAVRHEKQRREDAERRARQHVLAEHADEVARLTALFLSEDAEGKQS